MNDAVSRPDDHPDDDRHRECRPHGPVLLRLEDRYVITGGAEFAVAPMLSSKGRSERTDRRQSR